MRGISSKGGGEEDISKSDSSEVPTLHTDKSIPWQDEVEMTVAAVEKVVDALIVVVVSIMFKLIFCCDSGFGGVVKAVDGFDTVVPSTTGTVFAIVVVAVVVVVLEGADVFVSAVSVTGGTLVFGTAVTLVVEAGGRIPKEVVVVAVVAAADVIIVFPDEAGDTKGLDATVSMTVLEGSVGIAIVVGFASSDVIVELLEASNVVVDNDGSFTNESTPKVVLMMNAIRLSGKIFLWL
jgi:hypothetical protein